MNDLASDEEIFAEKNRECVELKARLQDLESSSEQGGQAYEGALDRIRQQETELVEQQTQIQELQNLLQQMRGNKVGIGILTRWLLYLDYVFYIIRNIVWNH